MTMTTKSALVAATAIVVAGLALWWSRAPDEGARRARKGTPLDVAGGSGGGREHATPPTVTARATATRAPGDAPSESPIDRDLDLHGIVVDASGAAVARATVEVVRHPLTRLGALSLEDMLTGVPGATLVTGDDGRFRIRLRRGEDVNLRVEKEGFAIQEHVRLRAGEKARLVLRAAVPLTVRVLDAGGGAVAGVKLTLFSSPRATDTFVARRAETGADGVHVFDDLPGGLEATLEPRHNGHGQANPERIRLPDTGSQEVTIRLPIGRRVTGRVLDAEGLPIAGAEVGMSWAMRNVVTTQEDGTFEILGWTGNGYAGLRARAGGFASQMIEVKHRTVIDFVLARGVTLTGRLVDTDGTPVGGVYVAANGTQSGRRPQFSGAVAITGDDGRFGLADLRADTAHVLRVSDVAAGLVNRRLPATGVWGETLDLGDVEVQLGRLVRGAVLDDSGASMARVTVELGPGGRPADSARTRILGITDDLGRFVIPHVAPGTYTAIVTRDRAELALAALEVPEGRDPAPLVIRPPASHGLVVRAIDDGGTPLRGVLVAVVTGSGTTLQQRTDERGEARFDVTAEIRSVRGMIPDTERMRRYVAPSPTPISKGSCDHRIVFVRGVEVSGMLVDENGDALTRGFVTYDLPGRPGRLGHLDDRGRFRITLPPGTTLDLSFYPYTEPGEKPVLRTGLLRGVTAPASGLRMTVAPPALDRAVTVRVVDGAGAPVEGLRITANYVGARERDEFRSGTDGRVVVDALPATPIQISATFTEGHPAAAMWAAPERVKIVPEGQEIVLALRPAHPLQGVIVDAGGNPVAAANVYVERVGRTGMIGVTADEDGRFLLPVPAEVDGPFVVKAWTQNGNVWSSGKATDVPAGADDVRIELRPGVPHGR